MSQNPRSSLNWPARRRKRVERPNPFSSTASQTYIYRSRHVLGPRAITEEELFKRQLTNRFLSRPLSRGDKLARNLDVLRLTHMNTVPVRELQQHSSAVLRRVRDGEQVGITDRGTLIAVLVPPTAVGGTGALLASGRVRPATADINSLAPARRAPKKVLDVLDDLRGDA